MIKLNLKWNWALGLATLIVLMVSLGTGYGLSLKHPLANDELYTQTSSIQGQSYFNLLTLRIPEGNVSPLFYVMQKVFLDLNGFHLPFVWNGDWFVTDHCSQIFMRIPSNFYMSLAVTLIFYFFARFYSLLAGTYAFLVAISSYMTWAYWVEARPYALWFLLSTVQLLLVLLSLQSSAAEKKKMWPLVVTHWLLALTVVFGIVQIAAASIIIFFKGERHWRKYVGLTILPSLLCLVYYWGAPKYDFFFLDSAVQLLSANFPKDRLLLLFMLWGIVAAGVWRSNQKSTALLGWQRDYRLVYTIFLLLLILGNIAVVAAFMIKAHGRQDGFPLSNRYFTSLAPLGIVAVSLFSVEAWRVLKNKFFAQGVLMCVLLVFLIFRMIRTWELIRGYYHLT